MVKRIYTIMGLAVCLLFSLAFPQRVNAAEADSIILEQKQNTVTVTVKLNNAEEEKVTAISLSLHVVLAQGQDEDAVSFEFPQKLEEAVSGSRYDAGKGILHIYAASSEPLFSGGDVLELGSVRIEAADGGNSAEVSVVENSLSTVNRAYGSKAWDATIVENTDPDEGTQEQPDETDTPEEDPEKPDDSQGGGKKPSGGDQEQNGNGQDHSEDNTNSGLNDENTQFINNPADAVKIPSDMIDVNALNTVLADLGGDMPNMFPIKLKGNSGQRTAQGGSKVTVIDPQDGPSGILVSGEDTGTAEENPGGGSVAIQSGKNKEETSAAGEEILLDQKNGGVQGESQKNKSKAPSGIAAVILIIAGAAVVTGAVLLIGRANRNKRGGKGNRKKRRS